MQQFITQFKTVPDDYSITGYDAAWVIVEAVKKLVEEKKPITRDNIRSTLLTITVDTLQGPVSFDANGDIKSHVVSVFQVREDKAKPLDDPNAQYAYIGAAPQA
jgi:ABC-type branched-subunit amino acid transport system substrate-binding protein